MLGILKEICEYISDVDYLHSIRLGCSFGMLKLQLIDLVRMSCAGNGLARKKASSVIFVFYCRPDTNFWYAPYSATNSLRPSARDALPISDGSFQEMDVLKAS